MKNHSDGGEFSCFRTHRHLCLTTMQRRVLLTLVGCVLLAACSSNAIFELLRPADDRQTWLVVTRWRDKEAFEAWVASPAFTHGHRGASGEGEARPPVGTNSELWAYDIEVAVSRSTGLIPPLMLVDTTMTAAVPSAHCPPARRGPE